MGPWPRRAFGGAPAHRLAGDAGLVRGDRPRLPLARPVGRHAVGRRGTARQDDPPPRLLAHGRHLRLRRAHHRTAPARRPADEQPAAAPAGQGQHRARRGAQAGGDRGRRPRRRPRSRRRYGRRHRLLRGHGRGAAGGGHRHRPSSRRPGRPQGGGPRSGRCAADPRRVGEQPPKRRRGHPSRGAHRRHGCRRLRQELSPARLPPDGRGGGLGGPEPDQGLAAEQPRDVHRAARTDPQGVREGQRREAGPVQRELRGRLPDVQRRRRRLRRPGHDGRRRHPL